MQITIKSTRIIKEGMQRDGKTPYKWVSVMADDGSEKGTEYTTFDAGVLKLGPGSVIDIGEVEIKEGKLKFKKVASVISEVKATAPGPPPGPVRETSPEEWKEKQLIERASYEAQTAFKGLIELAIAYIGQDKDPRAIEDIKEPLGIALDWAAKRLNPTLQEALSTMPHIAKPENGDGAMDFKNVGALFTACQARDIPRAEALRRLGMKEGDDLTKLNLQEAWEKITSAEPEEIKW